MDNILPFLASLCERLNYTPTPQEMEQLAKSSMIEMRVFFEAPALGISDEELFDKLLVYFRMRERGEKSKFKLTDPLAEADRKLSKPTAAIKPVTVAAPKPTGPTGIPAAMKNAEPDRRTWNKEIDIVISPGTGSYSVNVHNRMKQSVTVLMDFGASEGIKLTAEGQSRLPQPLHLEATVEANGRSNIGRVFPANMTAAVKISYRLSTAARPGAAFTEAVCTTGAGAGSLSRTTSNVGSSLANSTSNAAPAASQLAPVDSKPKAAAAATTTSSAPVPSAQQKPKVANDDDDDDEVQTERKNLAENLDIIIDNDGSHGYILSIDNSDARDYTIVLDVSASVNLKLKGKNGGVTVDGQVATFTVKAKSVLAVLDMPVDNFDLQMCELRYKAVVRKQ